MKQKYSITLMVIGVLLIIVATIAVTRAAFTTGGTQSEANIFESECISIELENKSNAITLNKQAPITDFEGLQLDGYTFTVKNTCKTPINYLVNLESLNSTTNTLNADYIKVALNSDTMDNIVSILSSNEASSPLIENAYASHNLYTGKLLGNTSKTFNLKLWLDYDTTVEQGASKTYTSKISVLAKSQNETIAEVPNLKTTIENTNLIGTITGTATQVTYCESATGICSPTTPTTITDNTISIPITKDQDKTICIKLDNNKATCTNITTPLSDKMLAKLNITNIKTNTPNLSIDATGTEAENNNGIFKTADGMYGGHSYYWRGAATTNHMIFDNKCWRIVRINGDGSIRLIYNGTVQSENTCLGNANNESTYRRVILDGIKYNENSNDSSYVGWTYTIGSQRPSNRNPQTSGTDSNAKIQIEKWYNDNIVDKNKVTIGKFCNDRNVGVAPSWTNGYTATWSATGTKFAYAGPKRLYEDYNPTLACSNGDVYELSVGMITADEVVFAGEGGSGDCNREFYLNVGSLYLTMTPSYWNSGARVASTGVCFDSDLDNWNVDSTEYSYLPVINLSSDVTFNVGSDGTQNNPYIVQ